ncbi:MAG: 16S rRNA (adenine(1518)-N(6)/adenine(1519)-N(6))-dimethyltransferase RsmA [Bacteroidales bacterium]|jgi:16S rRNA (adenine1518-N6/adenine1519-N6)-dimethyltransferase|nr:16S rRNA (adenine(1518)-N(6)/adenine(1519)-N(6))-dimethyltransferase RsmA [Bacteroidales bacterium]MBP5419722.1 16S rRNA (adenine(1518)-N(6)/adenine(1519)-N(6))-dimethyltransferase RsmA [Bacteroidales bacterium]MCR5696425.1 16S rRNA (adenine(1518)-N(6)/adenine(1519)-N(6))-dimethyltransferase RsmA [Marinilabiliaceae bacterium]
MQVKAKKQLGQHFLTDLSIAQRIVGAMDNLTCRDVVEIGPGMGVLTQYLLPRTDIDLQLIEIDHESVEYLQQELHVDPKIIVEGDFLRINLAELCGGRPFTVIGNFPYNISSQIFFHILDYKDLVPCVVCMLQREVAQRLASPPGNKDYGILSVFLQAYYDIEYLFTVNEGVFSPPPKVKSGVIRLRRNGVQHLDCDEKLFRQIVKATFNQRRKTIRNSIRAVAFKHEALAGHPYMALRPEQLSVAQFVELTKLVEANRG